MEVIYGVDCVLNALKYRIRPAIHRLIVYGDKHDAAILEVGKDIRIQRASRLELDRLVGPGRPHQDLALQVAPFAPAPIQPSKISGRWLALDGIIDPQNLGSLTRTAAFFSLDGIIIPRSNAVGLNPTVSKTSAGTLEIIGNRFWYPPIGGLAPFLREARALGCSVIGTGSGYCGANSANSTRSPCILVLGNEGKGIKEEVAKSCSHWWSINGNPPAGIDSLNVGVAAGMLIQRLVEQ